MEKAVKILNQGGIVVFPTDTAFGIGCRIDNEKAIRQLFKIRKRPETRAVPVLVSSFEMASSYLLPFPNIVRQMMEEYWPGAVTIVYKCNNKTVSPLVRGGGENIGLRIPNHPVPLKLIAGIGTGLLASSANFHKGETPYHFEDLDKDLIKLVDYIIPGECVYNSPSTVIDCTKIPFKIIRQGAKTIDKKYLINMILYIDTSQKDLIAVKLLHSLILKNTKAQSTLPAIQKLLKKSGLSLDDLKEIKVNTGPGSFVGLRVGISIANTLGFLLNIPVNGQKNPVTPNYTI